MDQALSYLEVTDPELIVLSTLRARGEFRRLLQKLRGHPHVLVLEEDNPLEQLANELEHLPSSS